MNGEVNGTVEEPVGEPIASSTESPNKDVIVTTADANPEPNFNGDKYEVSEGVNSEQDLPKDVPDIPIADKLLKSGAVSIIVEPLADEEKEENHLVKDANEGDLDEGKEQKQLIDVEFEELAPPKDKFEESTKQNNVSNDDCKEQSTYKPELIKNDLDNTKTKKGITNDELEDKDTRQKDATEVNTHKAQITENYVAKQQKEITDDELEDKCQREKTKELSERTKAYLLQDDLEEDIYKTETTENDLGDTNQQKEISDDELEDKLKNDKNDDVSQSQLSKAYLLQDDLDEDMLLKSNSDDDLQECKQSKDKTDDEAEETNLQIKDEINKANGHSNAEVHEIVSDNEEDCVITEETKPVVEPPRMQLRRSSRAIKRKRYDDSEGEIDSEEEFSTHEQLRRRSKPIIINDTKALVAMAARQIKSGITKREPTVVVINTNSLNKTSPIVRKNTFTSANSSLSAQNLYQSIVARGTTVTPISRNSISNQNNTFVPQPSILPSLTDDMFVVEAPSFIVPYVYEKPSIEPFREFVNKLGNELNEKAKEDSKKKDKEKEKNQKEKQENSEEVDEAEEDLKGISELEEMLSDVKKDLAGKTERRRAKNDDDDESWNGESSSDTDEVDESDDIDLEQSGLTEKKDNATNENLSKSDNYFDLSIGKFFMKIGLNLVKNYVQNDLLKEQNSKLRREKRSGNSTKATEASIVSLKKNIEISHETNAPYTFKQRKCEYCTFKSESVLALAHHLETPHMKNNVYKCNFCEFEIKSPHDILYHMQSEHNNRGKLERAPAYHQCANCPFEDNGKGKLARHLIACAKRFKPDLNLAPPFEWEPPAKIPKMVKARNSIMSPYQNNFHRGQIGCSIMGRPTMNNMIAGTSFRPRGRTNIPMQPRLPVHGIPILRGGVTVRSATPSSGSSTGNMNNMKNTMQKSQHQPSISITPLPRQPQPSVPVPVPSQQNKNTCVICEICDGYIKDLEQLRNHMQWIHRVKIHPKMIHNRPPLNCQKCQFRFFTDQGLERHLLGSHGLVTKSMQQEANKGNDGGRCPVCGRVYQWKLLDHVARDHNLTLKPAHLSYKCTVCSATFGLYKQFENHVYSAHSVVAKRVMDKGQKQQLMKTNQSLLKPLKISDEITIIPQPAKPTTPPAEDK